MDGRKEGERPVYVVVDEYEGGRGGLDGVSLRMVSVWCNAFVPRKIVETEASDDELEDTACAEDGDYMCRDEDFDRVGSLTVSLQNSSLFDSGRGGERSKSAELYRSLRER